MKLNKIKTSIILLFSTLLLKPISVFADIQYAPRPEGYSLYERIFTPTYFEPHNVHFLFDQGLMWSLIISNVITAIAYFLIPIALIYFMRKRKDIIFRKVFWLFSLFIFLCGVHHTVHVLTFWYPVYFIQAFVDGLTALVSIATFFAIIPVLPQAIGLRTPEDLERVNEKLQSEIEERKKAQDELAKKKEDLEQTNKELDQALKETTAAKDEADRINDMMTGREVKMAELKKENEKLRKQLES